MQRYSAAIMDHFESPRNVGVLADASASGSASLGGRAPRMTIWLRVAGDTVEAARFQTFGCGYSIACGSALTELAIGRTVESCRELDVEAVNTALGGLPPHKRFCANLAVAALRDALQPLDASSSVRPTPAGARQPRPMRVAVLSLLFNWPSTAGGIIHTLELVKFLNRAGYDARHFYARHEAWGVGNVTEPLPETSRAIAFDEASWRAEEIQRRFRQEVDSFWPDAVIITDSWNFKPLLAEAMRGYPYFLRQQAQECLCPLNNLRLIVDRGVARQCPANQLAEPATCRACLAARAQQSGTLHRAERALSGVGTTEYEARLRAAFRDAAAVLALNPEVAALIEPHTREVRVVTWGMDAARFPWPWPTDVELPPRDRRFVLFMAGVVEEPIKGFAVLHRACERLWKQRQDFELVVTAQAPGPVDEFTRSVGWLTQEELPRHLRACDLLIMPTIAQEGLARSTVEAMAVGRPVIASRLGGIPFTVADGETGLLVPPGDEVELAAKIDALLNAPLLREQMGLAGRRHFERDFTWESVIQRYYAPLLAKHVCADDQRTTGLAI